MCAVLYTNSLYSSNGSNKQLYFCPQITRGKKKHMRKAQNHLLQSNRCPTQLQNFRFNKIQMPKQIQVCQDIQYRPFRESLREFSSVSYSVAINTLSEESSFESSLCLYTPCGAGITVQSLYCGC